MLTHSTRMCGWITIQTHKITFALITCYGTCMAYCCFTSFTSMKHKRTQCKFRFYLATWIPYISGNNITQIIDTKNHKFRYLFHEKIFSEKKMCVFCFLFLDRAKTRFFTFLADNQNTNCAQNTPIHSPCTNRNRIRGIWTETCKRYNNTSICNHHSLWHIHGKQESCIFDMDTVQMNSMS